MKQIAAFIDWLLENKLTAVPLHFSRFFPAYQLEHLSPTPAEHITEAVQLATSKGMLYAYSGNLNYADGNTYCPSCHSLVIERESYHTTVKNLKNGCCEKCGTKIIS